MSPSVLRRGPGVVGPLAQAGGVDGPHPVDVPDSCGDVSVGVGGSGAAGVFHVDQQGVLALGGTPSEYLVAG